MTFTIEQIQELSVWEKAFETAIRSDYVRGVSPKSAERIFQILKSATNTNMIWNASCSRCIKDILKMVGVRYFADKQEMDVIKPKAGKTTNQSSGTKRSCKTKIKQ